MLQQLEAIPEHSELASNIVRVRETGLVPLTKNSFQQPTSADLGAMLEERWFSLKP